jgi:hypothetical protein
VLTGDVRSVIGSKSSLRELNLRRNDKVNMGHLIAKPVDGLIRLWCLLCGKPVSTNKSNTAAHIHTRRMSVIWVKDKVRNYNWLIVSQAGVKGTRTERVGRLQNAWTYSGWRPFACSC